MYVYKYIHVHMYTPHTRIFVYKYKYTTYLHVTTYSISRDGEKIKCLVGRKKKNCQIDRRPTNKSWSRTRPLFLVTP